MPVPLSAVPIERGARMAPGSQRSRATLAAPALFLLVPPAISAGATSGPVQPRGCVAREARPPVRATFGGGNTAPAPWPAKVLVKKATVQVLDSATKTAYGLVPENPYSEGPVLLEAFPLSGGTVRKGPTFALSGYSDTVALAGGSLWVTGSSEKGAAASGPSLCQVNPTTLQVVRLVHLPPPARGKAEELPVAVSAGSPGTIWAGYRNTLVHLEVRNGAILATATVPSGVIAGLATNPTGRLLYVSLSYPTISGKQVDAAVEERAASSGRLLASTSATSPVTGSVAGGPLTALPDGVATSFRTGMMGLTVLLAARASWRSTLPAWERSYRGMDRPPANIFSWPMSASTLYASDTLWIENGWGVLACVDPATGAVRDSEQSQQVGGDISELLGTEEHSRQLVVSTMGGAILAITPPSTCTG